MNHIENPMNHMKHNDTAHETAQDTARNLMNRPGQHIETHEPPMHHIENPMNHMNHNETAQDTASNLMNQKDPLSFSNRPAHADPRDPHRPQLQPSGRSPSRLLSCGITSRGTRLPESRREQDQKQREGRRKGLHVTTSYRKEKRKHPSDGRRERTKRR